MRLYVGNINFRTSEASLHQLFTNFGEVDEVAIINDRETGRSRGFAFVTMPNDDEARKAIEELNETEFEGRNLTINEAKPREPRSGGYSGGRGGGESSGGGGGYSRSGGYSRG